MPQVGRNARIWPSSVRPSGRADLCVLPDCCRFLQKREDHRIVPFASAIRHARRTKSPSRTFRCAPASYFRASLTAFRKQVPSSRRDRASIVKAAFSAWRRQSWAGSVASPLIPSYRRTSTFRLQTAASGIPCCAAQFEAPRAADAHAHRARPGCRRSLVREARALHCPPAGWGQA